jgi:polysaccharide pyruvyl transferase WcaK-like protein
MMDPKIISGKKQTRVLLVGYNGANNTGAEALLAADIQDIRAVLGSEAQLIIPTINEANLRRYVKDSNARIVPWPSTVFPALPKLVRESDMVLLVEGSTYMDTWTSAMLWLYLWTTNLAHAMGKPILAYAVDAGKMSPFNCRLVRSQASKTNLIITRAQAAADRLRSCGVSAPIEVTADNAFNFCPNLTDEGWVRRVWPEAGSGLVGLAAVNFYLWPVVMRPWGRRENCYKWPFYFTHSKKRDRAVEALTIGYAALADHIVARHGKSIALICMEQLDEPIARAIHSRMTHSSRAKIFSSREYNASQIASLLRSLDMLVTSRYHACVLSLAARVPQVAAGHDTRLATIYEDLGLKKRWFVEGGSAKGRACCAPTAGFFIGLRERTDLLLKNPGLQKDVLGQGYEEHLDRARRNRVLLADFVLKSLGRAPSFEPRAAGPDPIANCKEGAAWAV